MNELRQKLFAAFQEEYREHLERIRSLLQDFQDETDSPDDEQLNEAFRRAHSLKGAARAVDLRSVEQVAHRLESLFGRIRDGSRELDKNVIDAISSVLDSIEDLVESGESKQTAEVDEALKVIEPLLNDEKESPSPTTQDKALPKEAQTSRTSAKPVNTVRMNTESLDNLLQTSWQLLTESRLQDAMSQNLGYVSKVVGEIYNEWTRIRKSVVAFPQQFPSSQKSTRLANSLDVIERQLAVLRDETRKLRLTQRQNAWSLRQNIGQLQTNVRRARMVPVENIFGGFRKMVRDLAKEEGKEIDLTILGLNVQTDRMVLQTLKDAVMHAIRNAVTHGIESSEERAAQGKRKAGKITLRIDMRNNRLEILIDDDGKGIDPKGVAEMAVERELVSETELEKMSNDEIMAFAFEPGFSTAQSVSELSGRGMGLSVVFDAVVKLQGEVRFLEKEAPGTALLITVPSTFAAHRLLFVSCQNQTFAIPLHGLERLYRINSREIKTIEGKRVISFDGTTVPVCKLAELLNPNGSTRSTDGGNIRSAILKSGERRLAVAVDEFLVIRDGFVTDLGSPLDQVSNFSGGVILEDGSVALVINPTELLKIERSSGEPVPIEAQEVPAQECRLSILVVDDSITTRSLERNILEAHGYNVDVAVDGVEAWTKLQQEDVDLVIADIQMPRMNGFTLVAKMKQDPRFAEIPVILVTSMENRKDREHGLSLGVDAYIVKRRFEQRELLSTIEQVI